MSNKLMRKNSKYSGFTLVELLIVMAVIIILLAIGLLSGRAAIERANRLRHQNNVAELYKALSAYYVDNNSYPSANDSNTLYAQDELAAPGGAFTSLFVGTNAPLNEYLDGEIDGGGMAARYYYYTGDNNQIVLVCYEAIGKAFAGCDGNGLGTLPSGAVINDKQFENSPDTLELPTTNALVSTWENGEWQ